MSDSPTYSPPPPPDPDMVARAQGQQERMTARANNIYMNPTVNTPFGRVKYNTNQENIGGATIKRPEQTIELSPEEQANYDRSNQIRGYLGNLGAPIGNYLSRGVQELSDMPHQSPNLEGIGNVPSEDAYNADRRRFEGAYYDRGMELMRPDMERSENRLRSRLAAMGHPVGNEAYKNEMDSFERNKGANMRSLAHESILNGANEQRNMFGTGQAIRGEQFQQAMRPYEVNQTERRNRMGENQFNLGALQSLLGGQQVQMPQLQHFNTTAMRAPDIQSIYMNNAAQEAQNYDKQYQNKMADRKSNMSSMYKLAAAAAATYFTGGLAAPALMAGAGAMGER